MSGFRVDQQWRNPVGLDDVVEESMSVTSMEQQIPQHPIPTMQGAFEESMQETLEDAEESFLARKDSVYRRKVLLERPQYQRTVAGKWKQKVGEKYHPLWKLIAMLSFGMHLLHQELAKSDDEVIKILQGHVDEVDGFLERTTEDFDLAQHDINERIKYLQLPLEHGDVFDNMLMDRGFRTAMVDGNVKIEHIVDRTAVALTDSQKDIKKGSDGTKELARYLRRLEKTWHGRDEAITEVFQAMMGNTEGWSAAFAELQGKGKDLGKSLEHLKAIIAEIQRLVGIASRRDVPQRYNSVKAGVETSRPMSPQRPRSPERAPDIAPTLNAMPLNNEQQREDIPEPETQWARTRSPPVFHPNAILEEDEEYNYSPPRNQPATAPQGQARSLADTGVISRNAPEIAAVGAAAGTLVGLGYMSATSKISPHEDEGGRVTPKPFGRSAYSPQPDVIEEEDEESDDSDYTVDIVDATPITSAPVRAIAQDFNVRQDTSRAPMEQIHDHMEKDDPSGHNPPQDEFESVIPKPMRDSLEEATKEFILPPLDLESETPLPALTPLDYERMRANRTLPPFDLTVPEDYTAPKPKEVEQPKAPLQSPPHPFQRKESVTPNALSPESVEEAASESVQTSSVKIPIRLPFDSQTREVEIKSPVRAAGFPVIPRKPVRKAEPIFNPEPEQFYQTEEPIESQFIPEPDMFYQDSRSDYAVKEEPNFDRVRSFEPAENGYKPRRSDESTSTENRDPFRTNQAFPMQSSTDSDDGYEKAKPRPTQGILQLDNESFTPLSQELEASPTFQYHKDTAEQRHIEQQRLVKQAKLERQQREEEQQKLEEEQQKLEDQQKLEQQRELEEQKRVEEERRLEEQKKLEEQRRIEDEEKLDQQRRLEAQQKLEEDQRKVEEQQRLAEQEKIKEEERLEMQRRLEEHQRIVKEQERSQEQQRIQEHQRQEEQNSSRRGAILAPGFSENEDPSSGVPYLTENPRQLPIDSLLVRLRHGKGLKTPTDAVDSSLPRIMVEDESQRMHAHSNGATPIDIESPQESGLYESEDHPGEQHPTVVVPPILSIFSTTQNTGADYPTLEESKNMLLQQRPTHIPGTLPRRPDITEPALRRRASYSDNRMTQRPAALQQLNLADHGLLSPDSIGVNSKHYPHSARVPSSGPWTFFSKDDMDHSYRHRRAHSLFSPATPYDLEWILRRTPSDAGVSPMRWSEIYGFRSGQNSVVSPLGDPFGARSNPLTPAKQTETIDGVLATANFQAKPSTSALKFDRPPSLQIDLAIARGQLSQAADARPIQPSRKEPTPRPQRADRSAVRASSVYSKAPDFSSFTNAETAPDIPQIIRTETGYTSNYEESMPSSAYTDATFGQISPAPAISSARPSPLHIKPRERAPSEPASPQEDPKFPLEISDEKHTVVEIPPESPSLQSLVSATITGPEPDFPFLAASYGGPEPDYYFYNTEEPEASPRKATQPEVANTPKADPSMAAFPRSETPRLDPQQRIVPFVPQDNSQPPVLGGFSSAYSQGSPPKRREGPPAPLKLFPSMDSISRGPTSPRPQDIIAESTRPMYIPNNQGPNVSDQNLLALPPLAQEPIIPSGPAQPVPTKTSRSPLKKLFKGAISPGLLAARLRGNKDKSGNRRDRNSSENNLAREATLAHAQLVKGGGLRSTNNGLGIGFGGATMHRPNGSVDTTTSSSMYNGSLTGFGDGRRPSGERVYYGAPGSDGRPF